MEVREGFVEAEGHRLACLAVNEHLAHAGEPAVVFIHGALASVNCWRDWVPPSFREGRAWYALGLPAHHPSTVPADFNAAQVDAQWFFRVMSRALQELVADRPVIVVGHSTGGFCALNLAIHQAPNVIGIISVAGFHVGKWGTIEGQLLWLAGLGRWAKLPFEANILVASTSPFVRRTFSSLLVHDRKAFLANPLSQRFLDNIGPNTQAQDPAALFELFNGISRLEIRHHLDRIAIPCYVFIGSHDTVVPASQSRVIAGGVPGAKVVEFTNAGHMPFIECADACARALEIAIADLSRSRGKHTTTPTVKETWMKYPQFTADLQRIHESEVYGRAVFATAARLTRNAERKAKWLTLHALEEETLARYLAYMARTGQPVVEPKVWELKGYAEGAALGLMPWRLAMRLVRDATGPFQEKFLRLKQNCDEAEREFFDFVYAHEKALEAFAVKELANEPDSLKAVESLLAR